MIRRIAVLVAVALLFGGLAAAPVAADKPVEGFEPGEPFLAPNPCTGELVEFTIDIPFFDHFHQNNFVSYGKRTGSTSDGYTMVHGNDSIVASEKAGQFKFSFHHVWSNSEGSRFRQALVVVANINDEEPRVDKFSQQCLGAETVLP